MYRTIYMIEVITEHGDLLARRYAANKKTAERIGKQYKKYTDGIDIRKTRKADWEYINKNWVERM